MTFEDVKMLEHFGMVLMPDHPLYPKECDGSNVVLVAIDPEREDTKITRIFDEFVILDHKADHAEVVGELNVLMKANNVNAHFEAVDCSDDNSYFAVVREVDVATQLLRKLRAMTVNSPEYKELNKVCVEVDEYLAKIGHEKEKPAPKPLDWDMKVNVRMLPAKIQHHLVNRRAPMHHGWEEMTPQERGEWIDRIDGFDLSLRDVLDEWFAWEGIIGFTTQIVNLLDAAVIQARK